MPSHYLNQCCNIVNRILRNKLQWNFNRNSNVFIQENALENVVCEMAFILSRPQCVKERWFDTHIKDGDDTRHVCSHQFVVTISLQEQRWSQQGWCQLSKRCLQGTTYHSDHWQKRTNCCSVKTTRALCPVNSILNVSTCFVIHKTENIPDSLQTWDWMTTALTWL